MNKKLIPTYLGKSIFDIDFLNVYQLGYKILFIDLDNTLSSPYVYEPTKEVIALMEKIKEIGFEVFIISNNKEERVKKYSAPLNVEYLFKVKKPQIKKIKSFIMEKGINVEEALVIGDQVMTDVFMANKMKIHCILLNPLTIKDEPITFIPRMLDRHYRKVIHKKKLSKEL